MPRAKYIEADVEEIVTRRLVDTKTDKGIVTVDIAIDLRSVAKQLGTSAAWNKTKKSVEIGGAVVAKVVDVRETT